MDKLEEEIRKLAGKGKEEGYGIEFSRYEGVKINLGEYRILLIKNRGRSWREHRMTVHLDNKYCRSIDNFDIDFLKDEEKLRKAAEYQPYYYGIFWSYEEFEKSLRIAKIIKNIMNLCITKTEMGKKNGTFKPISFLVMKKSSYQKTIFSSQALSSNMMSPHKTIFIICVHESSIGMEILYLPNKGLS